MLIYCSIVLSRVKLTNAHTVGGRPTLKNNTECFRNGLVRELKEKQRKLWNIELLPDFRPTCYRFQLIVTIDWFHQIPTFFARLTEKENGGWDGTVKSYSLLCGMERHHLTDNINMCGLFVRRGEDFVGLLRVCASLLAIKGGGRPTRLLRHAKMLLIPIKFFFSAG